MKKQRVIIIGAAGRDFHNFNTMYRDNEMYEVVAFTAAQIPDIDGRKYPPSLAGKLYPDGIPIFDEADLEKLIKEYNVDECVLSYSDLPYDTVMHIGSRVMAAGAKFSMMGSYPTMIKSTKPVISICAVRTGCGKSQTTREVVRQLIAMGKKSSFSSSSNALWRFGSTESATLCINRRFRQAQLHNRRNGRIRTTYCNGFGNLCGRRL